MNKERQKNSDDLGLPDATFTLGEQPYQEIHGVWKTSDGVFTCRRYKNGIYIPQEAHMFTMEQISVMAMVAGLIPKSK